MEIRNGERNIKWMLCHLLELTQAQAVRRSYLKKGKILRVQIFGLIFYKGAMLTFLAPRVLCIKGRLTDCLREGKGVKYYILFDMYTYWTQFLLFSLPFLFCFST